MPSQHRESALRGAPHLFIFVPEEALQRRNGGGVCQSTKRFCRPVSNIRFGVRQQAKESGHRCLTPQPAEQQDCREAIRRLPVFRYTAQRFHGPKVADHTESEGNAPTVHLVRMRQPLQKGRDSLGVSYLPERPGRMVGRSPMLIVQELNQWRHGPPVANFSERPFANLTKGHGDELADTRAGVSEFPENRLQCGGTKPPERLGGRIGHDGGVHIFQSTHQRVEGALVTNFPQR
jgi:hypothetical protein